MDIGGWGSPTHSSHSKSRGQLVTVESKGLDMSVCGPGFKLCCCFLLCDLGKGLSVSVSCCCVTNYSPKPCGLKWRLLSQFLWVGNLGMAEQGPVVHAVAKYQLGMKSHLNVWWGQDPPPSSDGCQHYSVPYRLLGGEPQFLAGCWLEDTLSYLPLVSTYYGRWHLQNRKSH